MLYHHCPHTHRDFNNRYHIHDSHGPSCTLSRDYALRPDHAARLERHERVYLEYARRAKRSQPDDRREGLAGEGRKSLDIEEEFSRDESARGHRDRRARDTKKTRPGREDRSRHEKHADDGHRPGERERLGCGSSSGRRSKSRDLKTHALRSNYRKHARVIGIIEGLLEEMVEGSL